jgi:ABC-type uncharacterized transport system substrate-binding protein
MSLVGSLAHPGGNVAGVSDIFGELGGKHLELLKEAAPLLSRVAYLWQSRESISALAAKHRLPAIFGWNHGRGLLAYGPHRPDQYRRAVALADRILRGTPPGDLPVERPRKLMLTVNLKTAKVLGLTIPPSGLARADEVIPP